MAEKKPKKPKAGGGRRRRKPAGASTGLAAAELQAAAPPGDVADLHAQIEQDGGKALSVYREPYGGRWVMLAAQPIDLVAATPYQRNLSDTHVRKLEGVISKIGRFLDPIIAIRAKKPAEETIKYWTPNGHHRLSAMRTLGAKSITAIVVPEVSVAYQILALNTEKAHNLREKALEVIRMYREFAQIGDVSEDACVLEFEEPALITLGLCYEERPRFSGGAYHPVLKRVDTFLSCSCREAMDTRQERARKLLALDDLVIEKVDALKARGLTSPYLKSFVVARVNPVRFRPKDAAPLSFDEAIDRMTKAAEKFNVEKIKTEDLAKSGGMPEDGG
ncbi:MAG: ParB N-terminal domain-containing protein [Nitrospiraceae bacterium]